MRTLAPLVKLGVSIMSFHVPKRLENILVWGSVWLQDCLQAGSTTSIVDHRESDIFLSSDRFYPTTQLNFSFLTSWLRGRQ